MQVTTLLNKVDEMGRLPRLSAEQLQELRQQVEQQGGAVKEAKAAAAADKVRPPLLLGGVLVVGWVRCAGTNRSICKGRWIVVRFSFQALTLCPVGFVAFCSPGEVKEHPHCL